MVHGLFRDHSTGEAHHASVSTLQGDLNVLKAWIKNNTADGKVLQQLTTNLNQFIQGVSCSLQTYTRTRRDVSDSHFSDGECVLVCVCVCVYVRLRLLAFSFCMIEEMV